MNHELTPLPSDWLARARAQSRELANERTRVVPPRRDAALRRSPTTAARAWALFPRAVAATLVVVALASGAFAIATRVARPRPAPPTSSTPAATAAPHRPTTVVTLPPVPPAAVAPPARSERLRPAVAAKAVAKPATAAAPVAPVAPTGPTVFGEGEADFILVAPKQKQPPLFDPNEWKRRGIQP